MLRSKISVTSILLVLLVCCSSVAYASLYSGTYTFSASSPISGSSMTAVTATPGMAITMEATSNVTYNGPVTVWMPSFNINIKYDLKQGNTIIDTKTDSIKINSQWVNPGKPYTQTGYSKYTLPSDIAPGTYTLDSIATMDIPVVGGQTYSASFVVTVISGSSSYNTGYTPTANTGTNIGPTTSGYAPSSSAIIGGNTNQGQNTYNPNSDLTNGLNQPQGSTSISITRDAIILLILFIIIILLIAGYAAYKKWYQPKLAKPSVKKEETSQPVKEKSNKNNKIMLAAGVIICIIILAAGAGILLTSQPNNNTTNNTPIPSISLAPSQSPSPSPQSIGMIPISGVTRDEAGAPVGGAKVTLWDNGNIAQIPHNPQTSSTDTNKEGHFSFDNIPDMQGHTYTVTAEKNGKKGSQIYQWNWMDMNIFMV